jgi:DNA polymerase III alpha subunit
MRLDQYSNPIFNESDMFNALYKGHNLSPSDIVFIEEKTKEILNLETVAGIQFFEPINSPTLTTNDLDKAWQSQWLMPEEYAMLDIEQWIIDRAPPWDPNFTRVKEELDAFKERNMLDLLKWLKYFVDVCIKENILWGVGRGSSVSSYVLYIIGVHSIDPIKYNLDWREFLR